MRYLILAVLLPISIDAIASDLSCVISTCISVPGGRMRPEHARDVMTACDNFMYKNAGAYVIKMSVSEISDRHSKYGINDPIVQADVYFDDIRKSPLEFDRDWEKLIYQQIVHACNGLRKAYYNPNGWR